MHTDCINYFHFLSPLATPASWPGHFGSLQVDHLKSMLQQESILCGLSEHIRYRQHKNPMTISLHGILGTHSGGNLEEAHE